MSTIDSFKYDMSTYRSIRSNLDKKLIIERCHAELQTLLDFTARIDKLSFVVENFGEFIKHMENHLPDIICDDEEETLPFDD